MVAIVTRVNKASRGAHVHAPTAMPWVRLAMILLGLVVLGCTRDEVHPMPAAEAQRRILVFTKTTDYRHDAIAEGIALVRRLGAAEHFAVDASEDAALFRDDALRQYQAVVFLSPPATC